jgi:hypothetical protein
LQKEELIWRIVESRKGIAHLFESLSEEKMEAIADERTGWSIKALIAHLTFWEWATLNCRSGRTTTESLKDIPTINAELLSQTRSRSALEVVREFEDSGKKVMEEVSNFTDEELLGAAPWGDGKTLWEHLMDDTVVHYEEHRGKLISWVAG